MTLAMYNASDLSLIRYWGKPQTSGGVPGQVEIRALPGFGASGGPSILVGKQSHLQCWTQEGPLLWESEHTGYNTELGATRNFENHAGSLFHGGGASAGPYLLAANHPGQDLVSQMLAALNPLDGTLDDWRINGGANPFYRVPLSLNTEWCIGLEGASPYEYLLSKRSMIPGASLLTGGWEIANCSPYTLYPLLSGVSVWCGAVYRDGLIYAVSIRGDAGASDYYQLIVVLDEHFNVLDTNYGGSAPTLNGWGATRVHDVSDGGILVTTGTLDHDVQCWEKESPFSILWTATAGTHFKVRWADTGNAIVLADGGASANGRLLCLDGTTGAVVWDVYAESMNYRNDFSLDSSCVYHNGIGYSLSDGSVVSEVSHQASWYSLFIQDGIIYASGNGSINPANAGYSLWSGF